MTDTTARRGRPKVRDEVAALKRQRTLDAATDLFYERGYTNTTLDDVAARLGVTKPFVYTNFGSKPQLLAEICGVGIRSALDEIEAALAEGAPTLATMQRFAPRYVASVLRTQKNIAVNIREEKNLLPEHARELAALRQTFMARMETLVAGAARDGGVALPDPRVAAFAIVGAVSWSTFWFHADGPLTAEALSGKMTGIILHILAGDEVESAP
ncbi:TetR/AcrR family transcriptional regulator [Jannaschia sp. W003]|uniref:TetR/AcrR family transcriptional regulator n=1 Tax=Jannaschia sp. W003 TaxID=2867012 RepID=UPI0021A53533|nr:TetR/AcrR family transcriptional regulator [Jannaschia sp. W003]UWQ21799.1 TetR/AcrR family transcriptional regulator [Jannaschia sp. W003]